MKSASNSNYMVWAALLHCLWKGSVLCSNGSFGQIEYFGRPEENIINPLTSSGFYMHHQVYYSPIPRSAHTTVFICFVWISEQTAIISLYSINWLVCITETECV